MNWKKYINGGTYIGLGVGVLVVIFVNFVPIVVDPIESIWPFYPEEIIADLYIFSLYISGMALYIAILCDPLFEFSDLTYSVFNIIIVTITGTASKLIIDKFRKKLTKILILTLIISTFVLINFLCLLATTTY
ncbi:MAG: hypothetical protein HQ530_03405 [Parcubacteria group bacterium]|nr:hypothetical protein [Parcubacteria group bacterium]